MNPEIIIGEDVNKTEPALVRAIRHQERQTILGIVESMIEDLSELKSKLEE